MKFKPQLAQALREIPSGDYIMQPKLDGIRLLAEITDDGVHLWTRDGNDKAEQCHSICHELAHLPSGTWLDGEIVGEHWGQAQSGLTRHGIDAPLLYVTFDFLTLDNFDARKYPYRERRPVLEAIVEKLPKERVAICPELDATKENHDALVKRGYEGSIIRTLGARYSCGKRGHGLGKLKAEQTFDVIVTGYEPGTDVGALVFSQYDDQGNLVHRGRCKALYGLNEVVNELIARQAVIEVKCNGLMPPNESHPYGALRHPQVLRLRTDKPASECKVNSEA